MTAQHINKTAMEFLKAYFVSWNESDFHSLLIFNRQESCSAYVTDVRVPEQVVNDRGVKGHKADGFISQLSSNMFYLCYSIFYCVIQRHRQLQLLHKIKCKLQV